MNLKSSRTLSVTVFAALNIVCATPAFAQEQLAGKTITMIIGYPVGGGTDASGRLIANFFGKYLPGKPTVVVRNMPGADGMTSMNYIMNQAKNDGLTVTMASSSQADPINWSKVVGYDPSKFEIVGGVGRGGLFTLINKDTEKRLYDKSAPPVIMGSNSSVPRDGMQVTMWGMEFLDWNAKWVVGYPGTNDVMLAVERGEVDMSSTGNLFLMQKLTGSGKFKPLAQTGALVNGQIVPRAGYENVPTVPQLMADKIKDPLAQKAFALWRSLTSVDKWIAFAPGTPADVVEIYRNAFQKMAVDPEFLEQGGKISEGFFPMTAQDVRSLLFTLANTPPEALEYTKALMRKQGLTVE